MFAGTQKTLVANLEKLNYRHMIHIIIGIIGTILWMAYEMYTAPHMDDNGRITKPGNKLSDLFKKKK
jgi:hypothetical protein